MIRNILTCLDTTATYMVDNRSLLLYRDAYTEEGGLDIDIPNCFTSLEQASNAANFLYNAYTRLMQLESGVSEVAPRHERLLVTGRLSLSRLVENWKTALDSFMRHSSPEVIRNEMAAINTLKVQMMGVSVLIQAHNQPDQTLWDRLTPQFQEIVSLASTVISASAPALPGRRPTPTFSFDTGIVAPLFLVGFKCYNRRIRRQAIALLFAASRQEGIWNSLIVARVVQRVLEIEEEGCDYLGEYEVLPTWARLTTLGTQMDRGGRGYFLQYRRTNGSPLDPLNKIVEECMEW
ncbi:MAG: hypothetical protein M1818_007017 [Claussenomyces sp. TS43310]|nr:MAG: hypothetical protein M1818_007017 [Claussenomyces sp. TS43310]